MSLASLKQKYKDTKQRYLAFKTQIESATHAGLGMVGGHRGPDGHRHDQDAHRRDYRKMRDRRRHRDRRESVSQSLSQSVSHDDLARQMKLINMNLQTLIQLTTNNKRDDAPGTADQAGAGLITGGAPYGGGVPVWGRRDNGEMGWVDADSVAAVERPPDRYDAPKDIAGGGGSVPTIDDVQPSPPSSPSSPPSSPPPSPSSPPLSPPPSPPLSPSSPPPSPPLSPPSTSGGDVSSETSPQPTIETPSPPSPPSPSSSSDSAAAVPPGKDEASPQPSPPSSDSDTEKELKRLKKNQGETCRALTMFRIQLAGLDDIEPQSDTESSSKSSENK